MKKVFLTILLVSIIILSGCSTPSDKVLESLGSYKSEEYYSSGGFQDVTNYAKYTFDNVDFSKNEYFNKVSSDSLKELTVHIENFEIWIEVIRESDPENEVVIEYDFDSSVISEEDYVYIYDDPDYHELGCYDVYYFDIETMTLYYFHNNI